MAKATQKFKRIPRYCESDPRTGKLWFRVDRGARVPVPSDPTTPKFRAAYSAALVDAAAAEPDSDDWSELEAMHAEQRRVMAAEKRAMSTIAKSLERRYAEAGLLGDVITIERLELALDFCAYLVVRDGPVVIPIFERLERDLAAMRSNEAAVDRAEALSVHASVSITTASATAAAS